MKKRSSRREVYIRRQAILLIFISMVILLLIWLVQAVYDLTPVGHTVMAEQDNRTIYHQAEADIQSSPTLAIWQGSKGKPIALELQAVSAASWQGSKQSFTGIGKMLYCIQATKTSDPSLDEAEIKQLCQQQRAQEEQQLEIERKELEEAEKAAIESSYAGKVYLTFDDGPSKLTSTILDILAESNIEATFFVLGEKVDQYPVLTQRIVEEGHSIGNHSYNHKYDELYTSGQTFVDQVLKTTKSIYNATGVVTPLFRAPGGTYSNFDSSYFKAMQNAGYLIFDWNVDSGDSKSRNVTAEEIIKNVKGAKLRDRVVVLMHDSATHESTVQALPQIIAYYQEKNYQFVKITSNTEPVTSPLASSLKWKRGALAEKQAQRLKTETEAIKAKAEEQLKNMK